MRLDELDYHLPPELIAAFPAEQRDGSRLLIAHLDEPGAIEHAAFAAFSERVPEGALLVLNDSKVLPARIFGSKRGSGGRVELLLVQELEAERSDGQGARQRWLALGRASKGLRPAQELELGGTLSAELIAARGGRGEWEVELRARTGSVQDAVLAAGKVPLPPYLGRAELPIDRERYQTVYAKHLGSVAAPTAGLHLTERAMLRLRERGVHIAFVTLHVGLGTFQPVYVDDLDEHPMHAERFGVSEETAQAIADARGRHAPVIAVGTTSARTLEAAADPERPGHVRAGSGETRLLLQPGSPVRVVDELLTNFHLPRSTLLALVAAIAGVPTTQAIYRTAVAERYRFYSYGDAMWLTRSAR